MKKPNNKIELAGLKVLEPVELLTKKQIRYLLAGTVPDSWIYLLFTKKMVGSVRQVHGEDHISAGAIIKFVEYTEVLPKVLPKEAV